MSTASEYWDMYPHLRNVFEQCHGRYELGELVTKQVAYIGIHKDPKDCEWKEWFSATEPLMIPNDTGFNPVITTHHDARSLIQLDMGSPWQLPPINIFSFMVERMPHLLQPKFIEVTTLIGPCMQTGQGAEQSKSFNTKSVPQIAYILDPSEGMSFLSDEIDPTGQAMGLIQPVLAKPMPH